LKDPSGFAAGPVISDGSLIGVLIFQLKHNDVFKVFSDYTGLVRRRNGGQQPGRQ